MTVPYYRPKRKADLIHHLIEHHRHDHVVSRAEGGSRIAAVSEMERLYESTYWTVARLTERHDRMHAERSV